LLFLSHIIDVAFLSSIRLTAGVKGNKIALEMKSKCREKKKQRKEKGRRRKRARGGSNLLLGLPLSLSTSITDDSSRSTVISSA
jgi:hypothetical protein